MSIQIQAAKLQRGDRILSRHRFDDEFKPVVVKHATVNRHGVVIVDVEKDTVPVTFSDWLWLDVEREAVPE